MGTYQQYECKKCHRRIELGGPEEFYKTWFGIKRPAGHHGTKKIDGLWITLWCPGCSKTAKKTLIEFSEPSDRFAVWGRRAPIKPKYQVEDDSRYLCNKCNIIMLDEIAQDAKCTCGGHITYTGTIRT